MKVTVPESTPLPEHSTKPRRRRDRSRAQSEAQLALTSKVANWQARYAWQCAMWGLIPIAGVPLGLAATLLGVLGWARVRRRAEDQGLRHAVAGIIVGSAEILINTVALACIIRGIADLGFFG